MDIQGEGEKLAEALEKFSRKADALLDGGNRNTTKIEVNAGGTGVWIATTACLVMLAVAAVAIPIGVGAYLSTQARMDKLAEKDEIHDAWIQTLNNNKQDKTK
jgi:ABC-type phosphate transport system permease subunit